MKVYILRDSNDDSIVGISEIKEAVELYISQNNLSETRYHIQKVKGVKGDYMFSKYADTKQIVFIGKRDIVAIGRHADAIYTSMGELRGNLYETINNLKYFKGLNFSTEDIKILDKTIRILSKVNNNEEVLEDVMRDTIIFYLSSESKRYVRDMSYLKGEEYDE